MKKYFISLDGQQTGPYTIEQLQSMSLTSKYLVWTDGFNGWKNIQSIQELKDTITKLPPSIENQKTLQTNNTVLLKIILFASLVSSILFYFLGGFTERYELIEMYLGENYLDNGFSSNDAAAQIRIIIAGFSLFQGLIIGLLIYFIIRMNIYKQAYLKAIK